MNKPFGILQRNEYFLLLNLFLIIAKQHISDCRNKLIRPSLRLFNRKLNYVYQTESKVMKSNNKEHTLNAKWSKYVGSLDVFKIPFPFVHFPLLVCTLHLSLWTVINSNQSTITCNFFLYMSNIAYNVILCIYVSIILLLYIFLIINKNFLKKDTCLREFLC